VPKVLTSSLPVVFSEIQASHVSSQLRNSPANCAGEQFKPPKDSVTLQVCTKKIIFIFFFMDDIKSRVR